MNAMKSISAAQKLSRVLADFEAAVASENPALTEKSAEALAKLCETFTGAAELLLDTGSSELERVIAEARAKLRSRK